MPPSQWRSTAAYDDKRFLDAPGFAFEFLRRNPEFIRHHQRLERLLKRNALSHRIRDAYAHRWGLRFRESRTRMRKTNHPVDDDGPAECRSTRSNIGQSRNTQRPVSAV